MLNDCWLEVSIMTPKRCWKSCLRQGMGQLRQTRSNVPRTSHAGDTISGYHWHTTAGSEFQHEFAMKYKSGDKGCQRVASTAMTKSKGKNAFEIKYEIWWLRRLMYRLLQRHPSGEVTLTCYSFLVNILGVRIRKSNISNLPDVLKSKQTSMALSSLKNRW